MNSVASFAEELLLADYSIIPTNKDKTPAILIWKPYMGKQMDIDTAEDEFKSAYGVAVICGKISGGLECIDFDAHGKDIDTIFNEWKSEQGVNDILTRNKAYIEKTPSGGYHIFYRYDADGVFEGSRKLANWEDGTSMIETKAEGGYVIISPTDGYVSMENDILELNQITWDEREYLISYAIQFNKQEKKQEVDNDLSSKAHEFTDPISWFNWNKAGYVKALMKEKGWVKVDFNKQKGVENWRRPGKGDGISATWGNKVNSLYVFTSSVDYLEQECYYTPFQLLVKVRFKGEYRSALNWITSKYFNEDIPYIRVGTDYFKKIIKEDRYGIDRVHLKAWKKDEIKQDHSPSYLKGIPLFDDFSIVPDNFNYLPVIKNCYNLYSEFSHKPQAGSHYWSDVLMKHIFGEQLELGIRYLQALYLHPKRMLPILVLVSKERQTGKTTFINWLSIMFGSNMVQISPDDLSNGFNHLYATSNIIAVEETLIEKAITVEKLKSLATGKFISVNQKFISQYNIPFYGKLILASNNEDKFARVDEEEIRFFVRKVKIPTIENHEIEDDLVKEIPAYLHYLTTLPAIDWKIDRSGFTPAEIANDSLRKVKQESKSWLYKEITERLTDYFNDVYFSEYLYAKPTDIKDKFFEKNSKVEANYIRKVLRTEFNFETASRSTYPAESCLLDKISGTPFVIIRSVFTDGEPINTEDQIPF